MNPSAEKDFIQQVFGEKTQVTVIANDTEEDRKDIKVITEIAKEIGRENDLFIKILDKEKKEN